MTDNRPSNCRNRLRDEGKAYPRSGCTVCKDGGLRGCPYEREHEKKSAINQITREDVDDFAYRSSLVGPNMIDVYQRIATKSAIYPGQGTPLGLNYCAVKLNGEAGELAEHVGKAMRDDDLVISTVKEPSNNTIVVFGKLTPERRELIIKEVGDNLWYLSAICNELGILLSDAALANLEKLCDRTERDALRGSGDER